MRIEVLDRKVLHPVKHFFSKFCQRSLGDNRHQLRVCESGQKAQRIKPGQNGNKAQNLSGYARPVAGLPACFHSGYDILHKDGGHGAYDSVKEDTDQRNGKKNRIKAEQHTDQPKQYGFPSALVRFLIGHPYHPPYSERCKPHDIFHLFSKARRVCQQRLCSRRP